MENIQKFLAFYLDKLKINNPIIYIVVQMLICGVFLLFSTNTVNINESVDTTIIVILGGITAGLSPRTSQRASEYSNSDDFPIVDQSNN